ncbi:uncharacterized protein UTRI_03464_B [Ustilago trichophora]|uniref:Carboxymuconolactone decarboxylase-like domain-containing protein n=1 Tax=Ustilago trichophora TaxID=86804 RepID=A0A5C3E0Z6_9BASI|nr:uncharacterized protein UTRI_03464_B [Ustilago trichophora]
MSSTILREIDIPDDITLEEMVSFRDQLSPNVRDDWILVLTSVLVSCHHGPETIIHLYELAFSSSSSSCTTEDLASVSKSIQRQIQEVLVKASVIFGIPPSLDTIFALLTHLRSHYPSTYLLNSTDFSRSPILPSPISSLTTPAHEALRRVYRHNLDDILHNKMADNMQDLKFLTLEINYGFNLANESVIDWKQTELVVLAALIGQNCRAEVLWHMRGALRAGWTREDVQSVREVCLKVAKRLRVRCEKVPRLQEVNEESND